MNGQPQSGRFRMTPQIVIGVLVTAWGALLLAGNLGWIDRDQVWRLVRLWPLAMVAFGAAKILSANCRSGQIFGGVLLFVGLWLTAENLLGWRIHFWQWWPLLLIGIGVSLMTRAWRSPSPEAAAAPSLRGDGVEVAFWSGIERRISDANFRGADLTAIMGGIELDLRGAGTAGGQAVIDVFALMGGIEITVPPDWQVVSRIRPILGGVEDHSTGTQGAQHRLILRGFAVMGGVEIKT